MFALTSITGAVILAFSCSIDAFAASFAYGSNKIKIPMLSVQIINFLCSAFLGISLLIGALVRGFLPGELAKIICFVVLLILGVIKLWDSITKALIRKHNVINKQLKFSMFNFKFILNLYSNPLDADVDASKSISPAEAVALAISLSLDGLAAGFGAALGHVNVWAAFLASLAFTTAAVLAGCRLGNALAGKLPFDLSWLAGVILILLAVSKLFL